MKKRMLTSIVFIALFCLVGFLSACNTVEGIGKDVEAVGEGTQDVARDAKD